MDSFLATAGSLPLERYSVFQSTDVDEARDFVARIFCPHHLAPVRPGRLDARHHNAVLHQDASINYVQYGAEVRIEPGCLKEFYLLQMPLRGGATVRCGRQQVLSTARTASLPSPTEPLSMLWAEDTPQLIVKVDRRAVLQRMEALLQSPLQHPLVFDLGVDLHTGPAAAVAALVAYLRCALETAPGLARHGMLAEQAENHLITQLLLCLPHNHSALLNGGPPSLPAPARSVVPRVVRRAQEVMRAHAELPITLADVCTQTGTSARALQQAFAQHVGCSPMAWLRDLRLDLTRAALRAAAVAGKWDGSPRVAETAARFGFFHLGHFAAHYRRRFGELPSETVQE
jgi:AraC-like DNA-binding protein